MACFSTSELVDDDPVDYIKIPGFTIKPDYTVYTIQISICDVEWTVDRRYSEFFAFERSRAKGKASNLSLPPKRLLRNQELEFLNQRRAELENYIRAVFKEEIDGQRCVGLASIPRQLALFLDFHLYEVHAIVEDLALRCASEALSKKTMNLSPLELYAISERFQYAEPSLGCSTDHTFDLGHVAEHLSSITELKICGGRRTGTSNIRQQNLPFSLHYFKSLQCLWVALTAFPNGQYTTINDLQISACDPMQIRNANALIGQLVNIKVHNTLHSVSQLVNPEEPDNLPEELQTWCQLEVADLSFNNICTVDRSIVAFRHVTHLDLSCNCLTGVNCLQHLPYLRELNLSNNRIEQIENWHCKLGNVKKIWLTNNKVHSLAGLCKLYSLEFLDVRDNQLINIRSVSPVGQLPCLRTILLTGNGVENGLDWRTKLLEAFGSRASEVQLDGLEPSQRELDTVGVRLAIRKAKEDRRRQLAALTDHLSHQLGLAEAELLRVPAARNIFSSASPKGST